MNKKDFLAKLRKGLNGLPQDDIEERVIFYSEMIDDRIEEGLSEEKAVDGVGDVDEVIKQIVTDVPLTKLVKEKITPKKKLQAWEIILLVVGAPLWGSLALATASIILALYISIWAVVISIWAVFGSLAGCVFAGFVSSIILFVIGKGLVGITLVSAAFICAGLSIFSFYCCKAATKGIFLCTKKIVLSIKNRFIREDV